MKLKARDIVFEKVIRLPWTSRLKNLMKKVALLTLIVGLAIGLSACSYALWEVLLGRELSFRKDPLLQEAFRLDMFVSKHRDALEKYHEMLRSTHRVLSSRT